MGKYLLIQSKNDLFFTGSSLAQCKQIGSNEATSIPIWSAAADYFKLDLLNYETGVLLTFED